MRYYSFTDFDSTLGAIIALLIPVGTTVEVPSPRSKLTCNHLSEKKALPIALVASLVALSYSSILSYLSIYSLEKMYLHLTSSFFALFATMMLTRPFTGSIFDEKGPKYIIIPGMVSFTIGLTLFAFMNSPFLFTRRRNYRSRLWCCSSEFSNPCNTIDEART